MSLVMLWAAPPILLFAYIWKAIVAQLIAPEFHPRMFECKELDRAVQLLDKISPRLDELRRKNSRLIPSWRSLCKPLAEASDREAEEADELEAQKKYFLSTVTTLRRQPLERLGLWLRAKSAEYALGQALVTYVVTLGIAVVFIIQIFAPNSEFMSGTEPLRWQPFDEANAIAVGFSVLTAPLFYLARRVTLRRRHSVEFCYAQQLAAAAHWTLGAFSTETEARNELSQGGSSTSSNDDNWFSVLGLKNSASIDDVRKAYKTLIRENHPDRVQDMSPALKELAESETKKLNVAYRQALSRVRQ